jgi:hypothetical protein
MIPISGYIEEPERGAWVADLRFAEEPAGSFELVSGEPSWSGTVLYSEDEGGKIFPTRIVGGNGKLSQTLPEKWYRGGGTGNTIAADILRACGETAGAIDLPTRCPQYHRHRGTAGEQLDALCDLLGADWWVARDGTVNAGTRQAVEIDTKDRVKVETVSDGSVTLSVTGTVGIAPGVTLAGNMIRHVRYSVGEKLTVELSRRPWPSLLNSDTELDLAAPHKAVCESQNADGTLNLIVDGRFSLTSVPWLSGVPGKVAINAGDLVSVGFWNRDQRQPYAYSLGQSAGVLSPSARVQDQVEAGTLILGQNLSFAISAVYVPPTPWPTPDDAGKTQAATIHAAAVAAAAATLTSGGFVTLPPMALSGLIASGDTRHKH